MNHVIHPSVIYKVWWSLVLAGSELKGNAGGESTGMGHQAGVTTQPWSPGISRVSFSLFWV